MAARRKKAGNLADRLNEAHRKAVRQEISAALEKVTEGDKRLFEAHHGLEFEKAIEIAIYARGGEFQIAEWEYINAMGGNGERHQFELMTESLERLLKLSFKGQ